MNVKTIINIILLQIIISSCSNSNEEFNHHNPKTKESTKIKVFAERKKVDVKSPPFIHNYNDIPLLTQELVLNQKYLDESKIQMDSLKNIIETNKRKTLATNAKIEAYLARETQIELIIDSLQKLN